MLEITAKDVMTKSVLTIRMEQTVKEAIKILLDNEISGLIVVDNENRMRGIVSEYNLLAITYTPDVYTDPIGAHMCTPVISVSEESSLQEISDLFVVNRIRRMPVIRDGQAIGVVARRDVLRAARDMNGHLTKKACLSQLP